MAQIKPIKGLRFNPDKVGQIASVITPPYDVIDSKGQEEYYAVNPYNIIRLELGKKFPTDDEKDNVYTRAAETFRAWQQDDILVPEDKPALYLYQQEFQVNGETKLRTGFICGVKAEDYSKGQVLPHEETLPKHKADRLELMRVSNANFSPIFGLYSDPLKTIDNALINSIKDKAPDIELTDKVGEKHRLWVITNSATIDTVVTTMQDLKIYIADGHHRYETAVNFGKEMKEKGFENYDYVLTTLVNLYDEGLIVLPTHRLVKNIKEFNFEQFLDKLSESFDITPCAIDGSKEETLSTLLAAMEKAGQSKHAFGLYGGNNNLYLITLKDISIIDQAADPTKSTPWRHLDVTVLHTLVLEQILGIGAKERASEEFLKYTREDFGAIEAVDSGEYQISLLMNPTKVHEVTQVAGAGEKMPQKSTFFYPKVISGLVIHKLAE